MNLKFIECNECGKIYRNKEDLKVIYYTKEYDKKFVENLICPNCGEDALNFVVSEIEEVEYEKPSYEIGIYKLDFTYNDLINKKIVYRPAIKFECDKGYYLSEKGSIIEFKNIEKAKEYANMYRKKIEKNLDDTDFRNSFMRLKNEAKKLNGNQVF